MDYEKAYKAVLETATQWIKDGCTDKERICLESVFPELRESEDERIRKALVGHLKAGVDFVSNRVTKEECIAYLERQKEQGHTCDSALFEEGFKTGYELGLRKKKEPKQESGEKGVKGPQEIGDWRGDEGVCKKQKEQPQVADASKMEQPEVDLEKEIDKGIADYSFTKTIDSGGFKTTVIDYAKIARHFYELGLKARKEK